MSKPPNEISNPIIPITTDKISYAVIGTASFPMYSGQAGQWKEKQPFLSWVFSCSYHSIKTALPQYRKKGSGWKKAEGELKLCLFLLFSFIYNSFQATFLFSFENQERRKKDFSASFQFLFSSGWKERERKKAERDRAYVLSPLLLKGGKGCVLFSVGWWKWCCWDGNKTIRNNSVVDIIINQIF